MPSGIFDSILRGAETVSVLIFEFFLRGRPFPLRTPLKKLEAFLYILLRLAWVDIFPVLEFVRDIFCRDNRSSKLIDFCASASYQ